MNDVEPCRCPTPEHAQATCRRAGAEMHLRLWELCSGNCPSERPCPEAPHNSESCRRRWDSAPTRDVKWEDLPKKEARKPCVHLGAATTERVPCPPCAAKMGKPVSLKVFACAIHGKCHPNRTVEGIHNCAVCPDHQPRADATVPSTPNEVKRHLLYHLSLSGRWQWHVEQLLQRIGLFNGKRILAVTDQAAGQLREVRAALDGEDVELFVASNPREELLARLGDISPDDHTLLLCNLDPLGFAGQCLRVNGRKMLWTRREPNSSPADVIYEAALDHLPLLQEQLGTQQTIACLPDNPSVWFRGAAPTEPTQTLLTSEGSYERFLRLHHDRKTWRAGCGIYTHGGAAGDVIYALAAVREMGGGAFWLNRNANPGWRLGEDRLLSLLALIRTQPYLRRSGISNGIRGLDLDGWRRHYGNGMNISDMVSTHLGRPHFSRTEPWLFVEPRMIARVVVARSPRYHTSDFPWKRVVEKYGREAVFVGLREEHEEFVKEFGNLPYLPTPNYLNLAQVIAGCELFIGNQSSPSAIAQGLRVPMVQETVSPDLPFHDCHWERPGMIHGYGPDVNLPELS